MHVRNTAYPTIRTYAWEEMKFRSMYVIVYLCNVYACICVYKTEDEDNYLLS